MYNFLQGNRNLHSEAAHWCGTIFLISRKRIAHFKQNTMTTKTKIILGLAGAVAAGAIVGLLLAPEKGSDMRRKVKDTASGWAGHLTDLFGTAKSELDNLRSKGAKGASDMADKFNNVKESYS